MTSLRERRAERQGLLQPRELEQYLSVAKSGIDFPLTRSAAHPYGGRSACSYILEEKRQRSEKQRQYNISTHEVTLLPIRDVGIKAVRAI